MRSSRLTLSLGAVAGLFLALTVYQNWDRPNCRTESWPQAETFDSTAWGNFQARHRFHSWLKVHLPGRKAAEVHGLIGSPSSGYSAPDLLESYKLDRLRLFSCGPMNSWAYLRVQYDPSSIVRDVFVTFD
jgi:hypothetical protein